MNGLWSSYVSEQPIGKPVLGNEETIDTFDRKMIEEFMERMYTPERIVISVAGNYDDRLIQLIEVQFGSFKRKRRSNKQSALQIT